MKVAGVEFPGLEKNTDFPGGDSRWARIECKCGWVLEPKHYERDVVYFHAQNCPQARGRENDIGPDPNIPATEPSFVEQAD